MEEFVILGLRMTEGISLPLFSQQFGVPFLEVFGPAVKKLETEGLLAFSQERSRLHLTARGIDVSNYALAEFL